MTDIIRYVDDNNTLLIIAENEGIVALFGSIGLKGLQSCYYMVLVYRFSEKSFIDKKIQQLLLKNREKL